MRRPFVCSIDEQSGANFAQCEIVEPPVSVSVDGRPVSLKQALAECESCRQQSGRFTGWKERAGPTLKAALQIRAWLAEDPEVLLRLPEQPWEKGRQRKLSLKKLDLASVYACCDALTLELRKECSRFATVVRVASEQGVPPDQAAAWLEDKKLSELVSQARKTKPPSLFKVGLPVAKFPLLAEALAKGSKCGEHAELMVILKAAARECEQLLEGYAALDKQLPSEQASTS